MLAAAGQIPDNNEEEKVEGSAKHHGHRTEKRREYSIPQLPAESSKKSAGIPALT
jgi:hypothetical protein